MRTCDMGQDGLLNPPHVHTRTHTPWPPQNHQGVLISYRFSICMFPCRDGEDHKPAGWTASALLWSNNLKHQKEVFPHQSRKVSDFRLDSFWWIFILEGVLNLPVMCTQEENLGGTGRFAGVKSATNQRRNWSQSISSTANFSRVKNKFQDGRKSI